MKAWNWCVVVGAVFCFGTSTLVVAETKKAEKKAVEEEIQVVEAATCEQGASKRHLEVQTKDTGCTLQYTKDGKTTQIAASVRGVEICRDRMKKLKEKLESSGYGCHNKLAP